MAMVQNLRNQLQITSAENVALFSLLHDVPVQPLTNKATSSSKHLNLAVPIETSYPSYKLSLDTERKLTDTLAFLSSIRDDPNHIPAVCVGEKPDENNSLNVYIAINKYHWSDGDGLLQDMKYGFDQVFNILEKCSPFHRDNQEKDSCNKRKVKEQVFSAVVSMCSSRILARLSLGPRAKFKVKKDFKKDLVEAINSVNRQRSCSTNTRNQGNLSLFAAKSRELIKLVDLWTNYQTQTRLEDLVEGIYQLQKTEVAQLVLNGISNKEMDPSRRTSLLNTIKKVARYRQAARFLYRMVAKEKNVNRLKAVAVNLPKEVFERSVPSSDDYSPRLSSALLRIHPKYAKEKNLDQIHLLLHTKKEKSAEEEFSERVVKILEEAKIHAEIQLIAYCESFLPGGSVLPPRVICSSKDACYLCNLCIGICQRKTHTARSHGRVYRGWRLPLQNQQLAATFNQALESKIKESLNILLQKRERMSYPQPMESTLGTLPPSNTTLSGLSSMNDTLVGSQVPLPALQSMEHQEAISFVPPYQGENPHSDNLTWNIQSQDSHLSNEDAPLPRGISLEKKTNSEKKSSFYSNGLLEVQIEFDYPDLSKSEMNRQVQAYSAEWLDETAKIQEKNCHPGCVIDAGTLQGEVLHELCDKNSVYVTCKHSVFRLIFHK